MKRLVLVVLLGGCVGAVGGIDDAGVDVFDAGLPVIDAGVPDAGPMEIDAGVDAGPPARTFLIEETFETTESIPAGWTALTGWGAGTVVVSDAQAHRGSHALRSQTSNAGQPRIQKSLSALGAAAGHHWGRVFYKVTTPAPNSANAGNYFHITFVGLRGTTESRVVDTVESPSGKVQYLYNLPDDSCCNGSSYDWRYDNAWHCAEWFVDSGAKAYRFFLDGAELTSLAFTGKSEARLETFSSIALGSIHYVPSNGMLETWIDDLAIDSQRVGCE